VLLIDLDQKLEGEITAADLTLDAANGAFDAHVQHHGNMSGSAGGYDVHARGVADVKPLAVGSFDGAGLHSGQTSATGIPLGGWLQFPPGTRSLSLRIAVSFVDAAGASQNLETEAPDFDFDALRAAAESEWKTAIDRLELYDASAYDTTLIATALYHALLMPTLMSDVDGRYIDAHGQIAQGTHARYNDFSLWDTYRTLHPWLLLSENSHNLDFARSLVGMAAEGGAVPVWGIAHGDSKTMIGSPGEIVLAESALKGLPFDDEALAYDLARVAAYAPSPGPIGGRDADLPDYIAKGYVPADVSSGSVSKTQEYAVADSALARWAERLGRTSDAEDLGRRGKSYAALFDSSQGFFRGKNADGSWVAMPPPTAMDDMFVEGNAWHYLWMVPHDPEGLAETLGGKEVALERLREFFASSESDLPVLGVRRYYWPSNEPDISAPWFFAVWGAPAESWRWIDWIVTTLYGDGVDGLPGNDDGGTMSAWLLFAAAGLYPLPGTDQYIVAAPRQPKLVLQRPSGALVIEAEPPPATGLAPKRVLLDGEPITTTTISHAALIGAHVLHFEMGPE
jgi:predicted alpha-1,2-mannosidase